MKSHQLKSAALFFLLSLSSLCAEEHEQVGTRPSTAPATVEEKPQESTQEAHCGFIFDRYPQVYYSNNVHSLAAVSALGDSVELEDGSAWKVSSYDGYKAKNWHSTDPVMITQNNRWFSTYNYRIVNQSTGTSIEANLFLGPIKNGVYTRYIQTIDQSRGLVILTDNTHWEISANDQHIFKEWLASDAIIIGYNSGWDSSCEGLLINVSTDNAVRAHQF